MAHAHNIRDDDKYFVVDPSTRTMSNSAGNRVQVMQYDHNSERITFELPRMIEGHDMLSSDMVQVLYRCSGTGTSVGNRATSSGVHDVTDLAVKEDDEDSLICSWLVSQDCTQLAGTVTFQLRFICHSDSEQPAYAWHTVPLIGISVTACLSSVSDVEDVYPDILVQLDERIATVEAWISGIEDASEVEM